MIIATQAALRDAAEAVTEFMDELTSVHGLSAAEALKITAASAPVIVARVFSRGE